MTHPSPESAPGFARLQMCNDAPLESEIPLIRGVGPPKRRDEAAEHVREHNPLRRAPPELICETFAFALDDSCDDEELGYAPPWYLGQIFRRWIRWALAYPRLWTHITVPSSPADSRDRAAFEALLLRSFNAPLNVRWTTLVDQYEDYKHPVDEDVRIPDVFSSVPSPPDGLAIHILHPIFRFHETKSLIIEGHMKTLRTAQNLVHPLKELYSMRAREDDMAALLPFVHRSLQKLVLSAPYESSELTTPRISPIQPSTVDAHTHLADQMVITGTPRDLCPNLISLVYGIYYPFPQEPFFAMLVATLAYPPKSCRLSLHFPCALAMSGALFLPLFETDGPGGQVGARSDVARLPDLDEGCSLRAGYHAVAVAAAGMVLGGGGGGAPILATIAGCRLQSVQTARDAIFNTGERRGFFAITSLGIYAASAGVREICQSWVHSLSRETPAIHKNNSRNVRCLLPDNGGKQVVEKDNNLVLVNGRHKMPPRALTSILLGTRIRPGRGNSLVCRPSGLIIPPWYFLSTRRGIVVEVLEIGVKPGAKYYFPTPMTANVLKLKSRVQPTEVILFRCGVEWKYILGVAPGWVAASQTTNSARNLAAAARELSLRGSAASVRWRRGRGFFDLVAAHSGAHEVCEGQGVWRANLRSVKSLGPGLIFPSRFQLWSGATRDSRVGSAEIRSAPKTAVLEYNFTFLGSGAHRSGEPSSTSERRHPAREAYGWRKDNLGEKVEVSKSTAGVLGVEGLDSKSRRGLDEGPGIARHSVHHPGDGAESKGLFDFVIHPLHGACTNMLGLRFDFRALGDGDPESAPPQSKDVTNPTLAVERIRGWIVLVAGNAGFMGELNPTDLYFYPAHTYTPSHGPSIPSNPTATATPTGDSSVNAELKCRGLSFAARRPRARQLVDPR
ncbi:hypothetical protein C8R47DRAFT_1192268 [Mycena vitilis]|nr:hypothetical protein C8R47DRAFT_1192268 [Mycena vitilis]